jgi:ketosteroid isomerase-like protein
MKASVMRLAHTPDFPLFLARIAATLVFARTALTSTGASAQDAAGNAAVIAVDKFLDAQSRYNVAALRALTADQFVEISPLGEVDPREKMIGFYIKEPPPAIPEVTIDERQVRVFGDSAVVTVKLTFKVNGQPRSLRSNFVVHQEGAQWKLVSAQHTPLRAAKP